MSTCKCGQPTFNCHCTFTVEKPFTYQDQLTLETQLKAAQEEVERLEQNVCDECLVYEDDGTPQTSYGWNENRVEGQVPCGCIAESGPYRVLEQKHARLVEKLTFIQEIACGERQVAESDTEALRFIYGYLKQAINEVEP